MSDPVLYLKTNKKKIPNTVVDGISGNRIMLQSYLIKEALLISSLPAPFLYGFVFSEGFSVFTFSK